MNISILKKISFLSMILVIFSAIGGWVENGTVIDMNQALFIFGITNITGYFLYSQVITRMADSLLDSNIDDE